MKIQVLIDNPKSWFVPFAIKLLEEFKKRGIQVPLVHEHDAVEDGDILFILSCEKILKEQTLKKNRHNLVVHGSNLPEGRGWSPLAWEILDGRSKFHLSLIEAAKSVDSGKIYLKSSFKLSGHELNDEAKTIQANEINRLILNFVDHQESVRPVDQEGEATYYPKRTAKDSELNMDQTLSEQFNLLRVVDNERYPAFFVKDGQKYILKIFKAEDESK